MRTPSSTTPDRGPASRGGRARTAGREAAATRACERWLRAEEEGEDARAELALFEALSVSMPERFPGAGFTDAVVERLEREERDASRWSAPAVIGVAAALILLCGTGVLLFCALVGVDPRTPPELSVLWDLVVRCVTGAPDVAASWLASVGSAWADLRQGLSWIYSPPVLVVGTFALSVALVGLVALQRLLEAEGDLESA